VVDLQVLSQKVAVELLYVFTALDIGRLTQQSQPAANPTPCIQACLMLNA
jgi:hypothetical protein